MDVLTSETCRALNNETIKQVTSVGLSLFNYQDDARSDKHKIDTNNHNRRCQTSHITLSASYHLPICRQYQCLMILSDAKCLTQTVHTLTHKHTQRNLPVTKTRPLPRFPLSQHSKRTTRTHNQRNRRFTPPIRSADTVTVTINTVRIDVYLKRCNSEVTNSIILTVQSFIYHTLIYTNEIALYKYFTLLKTTR